MKFTALLGLGTLVGIGIYVGKKISEHKQSCVYTGEKETIGDKLHSASVMAVGTVRTGVDKVAEGLKQASPEDIKQKGEETVGLIKNSAESIKKDIKDLKDMILSSKNNNNNNNEIFDEGIGSYNELEPETIHEDVPNNGSFDDFEEV